MIHRLVDVSIIVPTFQEAQNLPGLLDRIEAAVDGAKHSAEIIIVDDNSCDGTVEYCESLVMSIPVKLIVRTEERGLSSAVIAGMDRAHGRCLLVMDADLSHPPERIPAMIASLHEAGTQMVIGSRYVQGGSTTEDWGWMRWVNSKIATLAARPFTSALDPMSGFFVIRRIDFMAARRTFDPIGYKIGLEILVKCGFKEVREIPIRFSNRVLGESKLNLREQLNYLKHIVRLLRFQYGTAIEHPSVLATPAAGEQTNHLPVQHIGKDTADNSSARRAA